MHGGSPFDIDIALGKPVCLTIAGRRKIAKIVKTQLLRCNRRELTSYYNFDMIGAEACGALKNIVANLKGVTECSYLDKSSRDTLCTVRG